MSAKYRMKAARATLFHTYILSRQHEQENHLSILEFLPVQNKEFE